MSRYTENDQERPILQEDLLDLLIGHETKLSCSAEEITPLNRAGHACQPNSSNQSNGTYKRNAKTKDAQL